MNIEPKAPAGKGPADWFTGDVYMGAVAGLRASAGAEPDDPRLTGLVGELSVKSEDFRQMWAL